MNSYLHIHIFTLCQLPCLFRFKFLPLCLIFEVSASPVGSSGVGRVGGYCTDSMPIHCLCMVTLLRWRTKSLMLLISPRFTCTAKTSSKRLPALACYANVMPKASPARQSVLDVYHLFIVTRVCLACRDTLLNSGCEHQALSLAATERPVSPYQVKL